MNKKKYTTWDYVFTTTLVLITIINIAHFVVRMYGLYPWWV